MTVNECEYRTSNETTKWKRDKTTQGLNGLESQLSVIFHSSFVLTRTSRTQKTISHLNRSLPNGLIWFSLRSLFCLFVACVQRVVCVRVCAFAVLLLLLYLILLRFTADLCSQSNKVRIHTQTLTHAGVSFVFASLALFDFIWFQTVKASETRGSSSDDGNDADDEQIVKSERHSKQISMAHIFALYIHGDVCTHFPIQHALVLPCLAAADVSSSLFPGLVEWEMDIGHKCNAKCKHICTRALSSTSHAINMYICMCVFNVFCVI